jgi:hypothetical protein
MRIEYSVRPGSRMAFQRSWPPIRMWSLVIRRGWRTPRPLTLSRSWAYSSAGQDRGLGGSHGRVSRSVGVHAQQRAAWPVVPETTVLITAHPDRLSIIPGPPVSIGWRMSHLDPYPGPSKPVN